MAQAAEVTWQVSRLIPTSGINGADEQERRATSALLSVMGAVKEFGRTLLQPLGAPAGQVETFIEVPFEYGDKTVYPDGLIRVRRGKTEWTALVEVKTGDNELGVDQVEAYLDVARQQGFDAVLTISNQIRPAPGVHPTTVDKRKLRKVALHHWSWVKVLTEAVKQKEYRGVNDPDQAWILGELIRYLEHAKSGALAFNDMGKHWVSVRDGVRADTIRPRDPQAVEIAQKFDALLRYMSLRLGQQLGADVDVVYSRKELADPGQRHDSLTDSLVTHGVLEGAIRIPNAAADLRVRADLRARQIACFSDIDAPRTGRARTRVNWIVRQLKDAPGDFRVEAFALRARGAGTAALLEAVREDPTVLIEDPSKDLRSFRITQLSPMGTKRGDGKGSFIESVTDSSDSFYATCLQDLRAWTPPTPKLPSGGDKTVTSPGEVTSTARSGPEPGE